MKGVKPRVLESRSRAFVTMAVTIVSMFAFAPAAHATIASDQLQIVDLTQQIAANGAKVKTLVARFNTLARHVHDLNAQIARSQAQLAVDQRKDDEAQDLLRRVAVEAYVHGGSLGALTIDAFNDSGSVNAFVEHNRYLGALSNRVGDALAAVQSAEAQTVRDTEGLRDQKRRANSTLRDLTKARKDADAVITLDQAILKNVNGDLQMLLIAEAEREAAQEEAENTLAGMPAPANAGEPLHIPPPTPGIYANPYRDIVGLFPERIDQGVDYAGVGPIYAIGDGIVLTTVVPGWPGGTMITYELTDGPARGLVVFAAEDIVPSVQVGDRVTPNTPLGLMYLGPDGTESGWGDTAIIGNTMARRYGQFTGANTTAFGFNFAQLLEKLGAPPGISQNSPPTGVLPPDWPNWS